MICANCNKDLRLVTYRIPDVIGLVCSGCRKKWRLRNEPGYTVKLKIIQDRSNRKRKSKFHERYLEDPSRAYIAHRKWRLHNPIAYAEAQARWASRHPNYRRDKANNDPNYKLRALLRGRLRAALKHELKKGSAVRDLGCSIPELKAYLESKFQPGMTWQNHGKFGWHIDHIRPLAAFDLTDRQQLLEACHFTNLQPLWWQTNLRKWAKLCQL